MDWSLLQLFSGVTCNPTFRAVRDIITVLRKARVAWTTIPADFRRPFDVAWQASSSMDPTFWPIHPTMERLFLFKRLTGTMTDLTWPDETETYTDSDGNDYTCTVCLYGEYCNGHRGSDVFPFQLDEDTDFVARTGIRGDNENGRTNREIMELLDPRVNAMSYVYDTFKWDHCAADGYDFNDAWKGDRLTGETPSFREGQPRLPFYSGLTEMLQKIVNRKAESNNKA